MLRDIVQWVRNIVTGPYPRTVYTVATLPSASDFAGCTLPVSDGTSNKPTVTAVNGLWKYPDGTTA